MSLLRDFASGLRSLFRRQRAGRELDEELRVFLEMAAEEKMKDGMCHQEALRAVRLERAVGLLAAWAFSRAMKSLLVGVNAADPVTFVTVAAVLILIALAACLFPASRATREDPVVALRYE